MDHTTIHPLCLSQAYQIDLHLWRGAPQNLDESHPIQILVNQGYIVGFCPDRLQPAWSAYRVAHADEGVDYDRPLVYYDDLRLDEEHRIGRTTFGKIGGIQLNVGHMAPNEVINRQYGRLAQMETFLMSNMSPQYASLNSGVWLKLEKAIREIKDEPGYDHVWAIVGPVFGEEPASIYRGNGKYLQVPEAYFCVIVDPHTYPFDTLSKVDVDCFIIPQDAPRKSTPEDYPATLEDIEEKTKLKLFPSWGLDIPSGFALREASRSKSRLMKALQEQKEKEKPEGFDIEKASEEAKSIDELLEALKSEAKQIQEQDHVLSNKEINYLETIQHTISWLLRALGLLNPDKEPENPSNLITYKIIDDMDDKLKIGARVACNFWNRFVQPEYSIVIRLGTFTQNSNTIARAYKPYSNDGVRYGKVEFNTKYLGQYSNYEIAGTITHEIGHSLGIGWEKWDKLFYKTTGKFRPGAISKLEALEDMEVELDGGSGTALSHWDEDIFDKELMTGYKDTSETVLPVTIDLMDVLGHSVIETLPAMTTLDALLQQAEGMIFSRQDEVRSIDLEYFEETDLFEIIPHEDLDAKNSKK